MQYDFSVTAGAGQRFEVRGRFFKYASGIGKIKVTDSAGASIELMPGQGVYGRDFSSLAIQDKSGAANSGVMLIGDFDFRDDTITGSVKLLDDAYVRSRNKDNRNTLQAKSFMASASIGYAGGSLFATAIVHNPVGSGKNTVIQTLRYGSSASPTIQAHIGAYVPGTSPKVRNKLAGGADSSSVVVVENLAVATVGALGTPLFKVDTLAPISDKFEFVEPVILVPGYSLMIHNATQADNIYSNWTVEFTEETN